MNKKLLDNIIFVLGIMAAIFFFIFNKNMKILIIGLCIFLIIISILLILKKSNYGVIGIIVGISLGLSIIFYYTKVLPLHLCITFMFVCSLLFIMSYTLIAYFLNLKRQDKTHELAILSKVIDLVKNPNIEKDYFVPVLGYEVKGEEFEVNYYKGYFKNPPEIGDEILIYVNQNDYLDVYFKPDKIEIIKNCIVCGAILIVSLFIVLSILL